LHGFLSSPQVTQENVRINCKKPRSAKRPTIVTYGYRTTEVPLPAQRPLGKDCRILSWGESNPCIRKPVMVSLGPIVLSYTKKHRIFDITNGEFTRFGGNKYIARKTIARAMETGRFRSAVLSDVEYDTSDIRQHFIQTTTNDPMDERPSIAYPADHSVMDNQVASAPCLLRVPGTNIDVPQLRVYTKTFVEPPDVRFGACLPHPDTDSVSMKAGVQYRFAGEVPEADDHELQLIMEFTDKWLRKHMVPLEPDHDVDFYKWIESRPYPQWRKKELIEAYESVVNILDETNRKKAFCQFIHGLVNSFGKDEVYPEYKYPRAINSRCDEFKCFTGPIFAAISEQLFSLPWFIKHVPLPDRPDYLFQMLHKPGASYMTSDFSYFEAHFVEKVMYHIERRLYVYMTARMIAGVIFMALVDLIIMGNNECSFKWFRVETLAKRMSGEMNTSLGNGFTNFILMKYMAKKFKVRKFVGVFEGDDGACSGFGKWPQKEDFAKLGFTVKLEEHENINTMSFCGMIFDPDDRNIITNPIEALVNFGWTSERYLYSSDRKKSILLRAKSYSMLYEYPGCPILRNLALYGLRVTQYCSIAKLMKHAYTVNEYEREMLITAITKPTHVDKQIGMNTRYLVEELYGVTVSEQIRIEKYLDSLESIQPLDCPEIFDNIPAVWFDYFNRYMGFFDNNAQLPPHCWSKLG